MKIRLFVSGLAAAAALSLAQAHGAQAAAMASPKCASGDSVVWMSSDKKTYRSSSAGSSVNGGYTPVCKSQAVQMGAKMAKTAPGSSAMSASPAVTTRPQGSTGSTNGSASNASGGPPAHTP